MKEFRRIIDEIANRCLEAGTAVSTTLAAFVAKSAVLENHDANYNLDHGMSPTAVQGLVDECVSRLLEPNCPRMDTIRMQVAFDLAFVETEEGLEERKLATQKSIQRQIAAICDTAEGGMTETEKVNTVHRKAFELLLAHSAPLHSEAEESQLNEREIAAALDSVFPRVGVKPFLQLGKREMALQLEELTTIVLGIRLFNKEMGKGGIGISDTLAVSTQLADSLLHRLNKEHQVVHHACEEYAVCLTVQDEDAKGKNERGRMMDELANKRQYLTYLSNVRDQVGSIETTLAQHAQVFDRVVNELQACVSSRATVPKEEIYPKFDLAARAWLEIDQQYQAVLAKKTCFEALFQFRATFSPTITRDRVRQAKAQAASYEARHLKSTDKNSADLSKPSISPSSRSRGGSDIGFEEEEKDTEEKEDVKEAELPQHLTVADAAEMMDLPLEFQGYCAVTLAESQGILLPGNPSFGMVRYEERYYVFHSAEAMQRFMDGPAEFCDRIFALAKQQTELIHLLSLQQHFPTIALTNLHRPATTFGTSDMVDRLSGKSRGSISRAVDAGTETPVHFIEEHKDPSYEWNEWALRRKALHLVNLRKASTVSSQTTESHFRRPVHTQVYLPIHATTQTGISTGTNPPRKVSYIHGLKGSSHTQQRVTRVNFQFDL